MCGDGLVSLSTVGTTLSWTQGCLHIFCQPSSAFISSYLLFTQKWNCLLSHYLWLYLANAWGLGVRELLPKVQGFWLEAEGSGEFEVVCHTVSSGPAGIHETQTSYLQILQVMFRSAAATRAAWDAAVHVWAWLDRSQSGQCLDQALSPGASCEVPCPSSSHWQRWSWGCMCTLVLLSLEP